MNELEEMRTFVQLVDSGTATRAAEVRNVAVSAISRRLKELERRLGVQLLLRTTRRMSLTDEGRRFYERAVQLLSDLADAEAEVSRRSAALAGPLKIAMPLSFGVTHLSPAIVEFMRRHPAIAVTLDLSDRRVDLVEEGFDLAIRIGELQDSTLVARRIATFRHVVCASPAYLEVHGEPSQPGDLEGVAGLCYSNLSNPSQWSYRDPDGRGGVVRVCPRLLSTNGDTLRDAAVAGLGVLCEPSFIVHDAVGRGELTPVLLDYQWYGMGIHAVYPARRHVSSRVRAFVDFLIERFGDRPYWEDCLASAPR